MARKRDRSPFVAPETADQKHIRRQTDTLRTLRTILRQWIAKGNAGQIMTLAEKREVKDLLVKVESVKLDLAQHRAKLAKVQPVWNGASAQPQDANLGKSGNAGGVGVYGLGAGRKFWTG